ncbi:dihydrolipoamide acetyltransferase family protein [Phenylobacterium montanum]|uniref:Dihydrolipoamide acetyltransferase component of pyruvate dehydrogenase complex n=1 Tax=Phenylobacterium montanum TaxID=2823693 RepID=A0A975IV11_9CAUL|nr:dihydrolipoamide acetyltransferase family protein [Caulobacter sp. S6]QUD88079.1 2-oxo acid dehydrogenase subunit E2 [Caulobacter sp. S6]
MARFVFKLPDVGEGIAEAEIVAWHVKAGDHVAEDQPLVDVMTDKATVEITAPVAGVVVSVGGAEGDMAPVGSEIAVFELDAGAHVPEEAPAKPAAAQAPAPAAVAPAAVDDDEDFGEEFGARYLAAAAPPTVHGDAPAGAGHKKALASPAVRARAQALGIDLSAVQGHGPGGRVEHADLDRLLVGGAGRVAAPVLASAITETKVIGLRRRIAEKMQESKRNIPHYSYVEEVDVTELEALRGHLNATAAEGKPKLSFLPFMIRALVKTVPRFPQVNALYDDEAGILRRYQALHVGIATQTDDGLIVPVVKHAEGRDVWELAGEIARLAGLARQGKASREELTGSTITLTSLGALGGITTTPVINRPEVAIVGPNKIVERPVVRQGQVVVRKMMNVSSSFDHRVVDGYDAASFIQALKGALEHPASLFVG